MYGIPEDFFWLTQAKVRVASKISHVSIVSHMVGLGKSIYAKKAPS